MENIDYCPNQEPEGTTWQDRLSGFTVGHFLISIFGWVAGMIAVGLSQLFRIDFAFQVGAVVLPLLYVVAGFWSARENNWSMPANFKDGFLAFLRPAGIAWAWGGLLLLCAMIPYAGGAIAMLMVYASIVLASPSTVLVILCAMLGILNGGVPGYLISLLLAGGIPPLFHLLGSLWGSRKKRKKEEE